MKQITDEELRKAINDPANQDMIRRVCSYYTKTLSQEALKACGDAAIWRCLQSHRDDMGQKFTSSLYRFIHWECLREINESKSPYVELPDEIGVSHEDPVQAIILQECLEILPEEARQIVVARYIENRTLADIGEIHHYSKQGIQNILARSLKAMQEAVKAG